MLTPPPCGRSAIVMCNATGELLGNPSVTPPAQPREPTATARVRFRGPAEDGAVKCRDRPHSRARVLRFARCGLENPVDAGH